MSRMHNQNSSRKSELPRFSNLIFNLNILFMLVLFFNITIKHKRTLPLQLKKLTLFTQKIIFQNFVIKHCQWCQRIFTIFPPEISFLCSFSNNNCLRSFFICKHQKDQGLQAQVSAQISMNSCSNQLHLHFWRLEVTFNYTTNYDSATALNFGSFLQYAKSTKTLYFSTYQYIWKTPFNRGVSIFSYSF